MAKPEKITLTLKPEVATEIKTAVAEGDYASSNDVIDDALRMWTERRVLTRDLPALRTAWREGKASGPARPLDLDRLIGEARAERKT